MDRRPLTLVTALLSLMRSSIGRLVGDPWAPAVQGGGIVEDPPSSRWLLRRMLISRGGLLPGE
eukprot:scaffold583229_cov37-Prasinocladus_malaysianus.AAC.1